MRWKAARAGAEESGGSCDIVMSAGGHEDEGEDIVAGSDSDIEIIEKF